MKNLTHHILFRKEKKFIKGVVSMRGGSLRFTQTSNVGDEWYQWMANRISQEAVKFAENYYREHRGKISHVEIIYRFSSISIFGKFLATSNESYTVNPVWN